MREELIKKARDYYEGKLAAYGASHKGVGWNSRASQELRFEQLLKVCDSPLLLSLNDYGCGYGALFDYMLKRDFSFKYFGFDISKKMIQRAKALHKKHKNCDFLSDESQLPAADYTVASGVFNVKLDAAPERWERHVLKILKRIDKLSSKGFSFNLLTKLADFFSDELYYADPHFYFDYCSKHFSKKVALLDDYGLFEFTILVKK